MPPTLAIILAFGSGCVMTASVAWLGTRNKRVRVVVMRQTVPVLVFVKSRPPSLAARVVGYGQVDAAGTN